MNDAFRWLMSGQKKQFEGITLNVTLRNEDEHFFKILFDIFIDNENDYCSRFLETI